MANQQSILDQYGDLASGALGALGYGAAGVGNQLDYRSQDSWCGLETLRRRIFMTSTMHATRLN